jgi:hypothetical protein
MRLLAPRIYPEWQSAGKDRGNSANSSIDDEPRGLNAVL